MKKDLTKNITKPNKDGLTLVDMVNFCVLSEKYKQYVEDEEMLKSMENNAEFLMMASNLISEQIALLDNAQKLLLTEGYKPENREKTKELFESYKEGLEIVNQLVKSFEIASTPVYSEEQQLFS